MIEWSICMFMYCIIKKGVEWQSGYIHSTCLKIRHRCSTGHIKKTYGQVLAPGYFGTFEYIAERLFFRQQSLKNSLFFQQAYLDSWSVYDVKNTIAHSLNHIEPVFYSKITYWGAIMALARTHLPLCPQLPRDEREEGQSWIVRRHSPPCYH